MDHLRPFQRLDSLRTGDDKEGGISTREEMEGSSIDLGPDPELSYDERVIIVSPSMEIEFSRALLSVLMVIFRTRSWSESSIGL